MCDFLHRDYVDAALAGVQGKFERGPLNSAEQPSLAVADNLFFLPCPVFESSLDRGDAALVRLRLHGSKVLSAPERRMAVDSEAATEEIFATVLKRGVASGAFAIAHVELTASLIKPLLQDWYVKRAKYRRRGTAIEDYIQAVIGIVEASVHSVQRSSATRSIGRYR